MCVCVCVCVCACVGGCVCMCVFNRKRKVFVDVGTSYLHKGELLKYHEYFPTLAFQRSLSIEIAL